ncbi:MAG: M24 family metallopeptidase [Anaeromyxobacter sp.]
MSAAAALVALALAAPAFPPVRTAAEQGALRDRVVRARADRLIGPAMKANGIGIWITLTREDAPDPLVRLLTPDGTYPGSRNAYVFLEEGKARATRVAVGSHQPPEAAGFWDEAVEARGDEVGARLRALADRVPGPIAVNQAEATPLADGLSASARAWLEGVLGPHAARLVSSERLVVDVLEPRLPEELPAWREAAAITRGLWETAFDRKLLVPGKTTVGDLVARLRERAAAQRVDLWFRPDFRVQRRGRAFDPGTPTGLEVVIEPGDLLHIDVGIVYAGLLSTDYQRMAYVPRAGERAPPPGLAAALAGTNRLQDLLGAEMRAGRTGPEVHEAAMKAASAAGLAAQIYSHSIGTSGHFVGAAIGSFRPGPGARPSLRATLPLRLGAGTAMELNTKAAVPEWGGQEVYAMEEDTTVLEPAGPRFLVPRQTALYLVR